MLKLKKYLLVAALSLIGAGLAPAQPAAPGSVLILFDSSGDQGWIGAQHAQLLANLMGHFDLPCQLEAVENYQAGDLNRARATFYFGLVYNNPLPPAFLADALATTNPVCWFKYNLWQVDTNVLARGHGFQFDDLDDAGYSNIVYKGESFSKDQLDPELGRVIISDTNRALTPMVAWRTNAGTAVSIPYATHGGSFWYIADSPFDYTSEEDRYVPFADLLHDIVRIDAPVNHRAIIRIEDVSPEIYTPEELWNLSDLLSSNNVPFALAVIPVYLDPLGAYNDGVPRSHHLSDTNDPTAVAFLGAIRHAVASGAQIIIHGYTHQYDSTPNPLTGTSGDDYEFWRVTYSTNDPMAFDLFGPIPEDSPAWAFDRIQSAKAELSQAGLGWVAWEPPHYAASAADYLLFATNFPLTMQRVLYTDDAGHSAGQFFPYVIDRDEYGQKIIPENLGNYAPVAGVISAAHSTGDIVRTARKNLVVRDGWANAYYHGFYDLTNLNNIVGGIQALGYTYVPLSAQVPPSITAEPQGQNSLVGAPVTLSVAAVGTAPLVYQWQVGGTNLTGQNAASLVRSNVQFADAGAYTVSITNNFGAVTSYVATLVVDGPPAITTQPQSQTNLQFTPATFQVVAIGSRPLAYQWQFGGTNLDDATNCTFNLDSVDVPDAGGYTVVVSNSYGAVTSSVATLTVAFLPSVTTPPQDRTNYTGTTATFSVVAGGTGPFHYQWQFNEAAIAGATNVTLNLPNLKTNAAGGYDVVVANAYTSVTSAVAVLTVLPALPPVITAQPAGLYGVPGSEADFEVTAGGSTPLGYQWRFNNVNIAGATNATFVLANVVASSAGNYSVLVTNQFGSVLSKPALLVVGIVPSLLTQPASRTNLAGTVAVFSTVATGTAPFHYQWQFNGTNLNAALGASLVLANVQSNSAGDYNVIVTNNFGAVTSAVATLTVHVPAKVVVQPQSQTVLIGTDALLSVGAVGTDPLSYQWRFNNVNIPEATNTTLVVTNLQTARVGLYSALVTNAYGLSVSTSARLILGYPVVITTQPVSRTNLAGATVIFSTVATGTVPLHYQWQFNGTNLPGATAASLVLVNVQSNRMGDYTVVVTNIFNAVTSTVATLTVHVPAKIVVQPQSQTILIGTDALLSVGAVGTDPLSYQWRFNNVNIPDATNTTLVVTNLQTARAGLYSVAATNAYGAAVSAYAQLTLGFMPAITTQPVSRTNLAGATVVFSTVATGTAPLHYQWEFDGTNLPGAMAASLVLVNVQSNRMGNYDVIVTNIFGAVTSAVATLTVHTPARIIVQPQSQTVLIGTDALLSVVAGGTDPLGYQWRFNNVNIPDATNTTLVVTNLQTAGVGNYSVVVTNVYGVVVSSFARLTLGFTPSITTQPVSRTNLVGTAAVFSTVATGTAPLHYQWQFNGTNLTGATAATLVLANVQSNQIGGYTVVVTNVFGAVTSEAAALTVNVPARIVVQPQSQTVELGTDAEFNVGAFGTDPLSYQWRFNGVNIAGASDATLVVTNLQAADVGYYSVLVTNAFGAAVSLSARLLLGYPATIISQPVSRTNQVGTAAVFTTVATGTVPVHYQWQFNGSNLAGATLPSLTLVNLQGNRSGDYTVMVTNIYNAVTSAVATLTVTGR